MVTIQGFLDGFEAKTSSKGNVYADIYFRGVNEAGDADFRQLHFRTFEEEVVSKLRTHKSGDFLTFNLEVKDAIVTNLGV